jgi:hypothetical protein
MNWSTVCRPQDELELVELSSCLELVTQSRAAVADARGQFENQ